MYTNLDGVFLLLVLFHSTVNSRPTYTNVCDGRGLGLLDFVPLGPVAAS
jgi:hypothetical protein